MTEALDDQSMQTLRTCLHAASTADGSLRWLADRLHRTEADLEAQTALLRTVLDESPDLILLKDHEGRFLLANQPVAAFYGTTPEAIVGHLDRDFGVPPEMAEAMRQNVLAIMASGQTETVLEESRDARTGEISHFRSIKKPFSGPDGLPRILVIAHDITDLHRAQMRAEDSERRLLHALEATGDAVWDWHLPSGRLTLSQRWHTLFGYDPAEFSGTLDDFWCCVPDEERADVQRALDDCLAGRSTYLQEHRMRRKDGRLLWVQDRGRVVERAPDGQPLRMVGSIGDITQQKRAQDLIWQQANYDTLTGLPNRNMFLTRLQQEMSRSDGTGQSMALLMLDLDNFKEVNDTLGHAWGDVLLQEAAHRLQQCVRGTDIVARLGGDEFTLVLGGLADPSSVARVAQAVLQAVSEPFALGSDQAYVSGSLGITLYPTDGVHDVNGLLKNADQAMYAAKQQGRNRSQYFTPSMQQVAQERMRLISDLRPALEKQQFHLCYQPIVELASGRICKAEALVRWTHPTRGVVSPVEFIPVAESTGMIHALGSWVFHEAMHQTARWRVHRPQFQVSVNVSPLQFQNSRIDLIAWRQHLSELGLDGHSVVLEITEGLLMEAGSQVLDQMLKLRDAGIQVALDDFGTGYSSLAYLNRFDIDYIKIDRSFVRDLQPDSPELALCEGIVMMAHKLGLKVVAEGIETQAQHDLLLAASCDYGQGYLYARPVLAEEFDRLLAAEAPV